jgi:hypothetical protein
MHKRHEESLKFREYEPKIVNFGAKDFKKIIRNFIGNEKEIKF